MKPRNADKKLMVAFFDLLETKSYEKITVAEIVEAAGLSRTTFYRYYTDVYDMYDKISVGVIDRIIAELAVTLTVKSISRSERFQSFSEKLEGQKRYIRLLCGEKGGKEFFEIVTGRVFHCMNECGSLLNTGDFFAVKFVFYSGIATYLKTIMDGTEFDSRYVEMYKRIFAEAKEAGRENE